MLSILIRCTANMRICDGASNDHIPDRKGKIDGLRKESAPKSAGAQKAVALLIVDHREVKTLFGKYEKLAEGPRVRPAIGKLWQRRSATS